MTAANRTLESMTKRELIAWFRSRPCHREPTLREVLSARWYAMSEKIRHDYDAELEEWKRTAPDFKARDALAQQANATTDIDEKIALLRKIGPYDEALRAHMRRCKALDKRQARCDELWQQVEAAWRQEDTNAS